MTQVIDLGNAMKIHKENVEAFQEKNQGGFSQKQVVFVLGRSQIGKSTFLNFLKDMNMLIQNEDSEIVLKQEYLKEGFQIGNGDISCTTAPNILYTEDMIFIDCPGFGDTNIQNELPNSAYIKHLTTICQKIKILLVVSADVFEERFSISREVYQELFNFVGDSFIPQLTQSLLLVLTKVDRQQIAMLGKQISGHINKYEFQNIAKEHLYKEFFAKITQNPIYFYRADQDSIGNTLKERNNILKIIQLLTCLDKVAIDNLNPVISVKAQIQLSDKLTDYKTQANDSFESIVSQIADKEFLDYQYQRQQEIKTKIELLQKNLSPKQSYELHDIQRLTTITKEWISNQNYKLPKEQIDQLNEVHKIFSFYSCFKYCIKELQQPIDFGTCFLSKLDNFLIELKNKIEIHEKNEQIKENTRLAQIEEQKAKTQTLLAEKIQKDVELQQTQIEAKKKEIVDFEHAGKLKQEIIDQEIKNLEEQGVQIANKNTSDLAQAQKDQEAQNDLFVEKLKAQELLQKNIIKMQEQLKEIAKQCEIKQKDMSEQDKKACQEYEQKVKDIIKDSEELAAIKAQRDEEDRQREAQNNEENQKKQAQYEERERLLLKRIQELQDDDWACYIM